MFRKHKSPKKIVVIGGGTGTFPVLIGLKKYFSDITAIVTMADNGGSAGILREEFGILPPGDVRRALVALARSDNPILAKLFTYRFVEGKGLNGHSFGNLMLTALERITGDFQSAINEAGRILSVDGRVLPVTFDRVTLCAKLDDETIIRGETDIDIPKHDPRLHITRAWLEPHATVSADALQSIMNAELIILGPGDIYTSILPNLLVKGVGDALRKTKAKIAYFVNLLTKRGETHGFLSSDFLRVIEEHIGPRIIDYVVVNNRRPSNARLAPYVREGAEFVEINFPKTLRHPRVITADLLRERGYVRHDSVKVAQLIKRLLA